MNARVVVAVVCGLLPVMAACGGTAAFPEPAECLTPAPLPTSARTPGTTSPSAYRDTIENGVRRMSDSLDDFRGTYPSGNFSRKAEFREHFATYSDETRCTATYLRDLPPANPSFAERDGTLDKVLDELIRHTEFGRQAVRQRNVSEWRQWRDGVDAKLNAVREASRALR